MQIRLPDGRQAMTEIPLSPPFSKGEIPLLTPPLIKGEKERGI